MIHYPEASFSLLRFQNEFTDLVCKLVDDSATLQLIAEEKAERLTTPILNQWIGRAEEAFVLVLHSELVGFGTIGCKEWIFPEGFCEVGHLIIKSDRRRRGYGSILLLCLLDEIRERGFKFAAGRVCVGNEPARRLIKKAGWQKTNDPAFIHDNRFEWFYRECKIQISQSLLLY